MSNGAAELVGRTVIAPARIWPDLAPPKGKSGWEGTVTGIKSKSPELLWIKFPGDPSRYFFEGKDVRSWLVKEEKKPKEEKPKTSKAEAGKPESSKPVAKKRPAEEKPGSPQKKEKTSGAPTGLKPLPPKPTVFSPTKPNKEELLEELEGLVKKMSTSQVSQLLEEAKKIASSGSK